MKRFRNWDEYHVSDLGSYDCTNNRSVVIYIDIIQYRYDED